MPSGFAIGRVSRGPTASIDRSAPGEGGYDREHIYVARELSLISAVASTLRHSNLA